MQSQPQYSVPLRQQKCSNPGSSKFKFTSASVLPKKHHEHEFREIIEDKKVYQTMIKQELKKLEALEKNTLDPEVEQFQLPEPHDALVDKPRKHKFAKIKQENPQQQQQEASVLDSQEQKLATLFTRYLLMGLMQFFQQFTEIQKQAQLKQKASLQFEYELRLRKCFKALRNYSEQSLNIRLLTMAPIVEMIKRNNLLRLYKVHTLKITQNKENALSRIRKVRVIKQSIQIWCHLRQRKKQRLQNQQNLIHNRMRRFYRLFAEQFYKKVSIETAESKLLVTRRKRFIDKLKLKNEAVKQSQAQTKFDVQINQKIINNLTRMLKSNLSSEEQILKFCELNQIPGSDLQKILFQQKRQNLVRMVQTIQRRKTQQFIAQLAKNRVTGNRFLETLSEKLCENRIKSFYSKLSSSYQQQSMQKKLWEAIVSKYLSIFLDNARYDIQYKKAITRCLNGSKQWLAKNKRIFEAEPQLSRDEDAGPSEPSVGLRFTHPLNKQKAITLLRRQSRYRNIYKKTIFCNFIDYLRANLVHAQSARMALFAGQQMYKNRLNSKAFSTLKQLKSLKGHETHFEEQSGGDVSFEQERQEQLRLISEIFVKTFLSRLNQVRNFRLKINQVEILRLQKGVKNIRSAFFASKAKEEIKKKQKNLTSAKKADKIARILEKLKYNLIYSQKGYFSETNDKKITTLLNNIQKGIQDKQKQKFILSLTSFLRLKQSYSTLKLLYLGKKINQFLKIGKYLCSFGKLKFKIQQVFGRRSSILKKKAISAFRISFYNNNSLKGNRTTLCRELNKLRILDIFKTWKQLLAQNKKTAHNQEQAAKLAKSVEMCRKKFFFYCLSSPHPARYYNTENNFGKTAQVNAPSQRGSVHTLKNQTASNQIGDQTKKNEQIQSGHLRQASRSLTWQQKGSQKNIKSLPAGESQTWTKRQGHRGEKQIQDMPPPQQNQMQIGPQFTEGSSSGFPCLADENSGVGREESSEQTQLARKSVPSGQNIARDLTEEDISMNRMLTPQEQEQDSSLSASRPNFREAYTLNKYYERLTSKAWEALKSEARNQKRDQGQLASAPEPEPEPDDSGILVRAFQGWSALTRQKKLVRMYLQQWEQEMHYYPHSPQEYLEFVCITQSE